MNWINIMRESVLAQSVLIDTCEIEEIGGRYEIKVKFVPRRPFDNEIYGKMGEAVGKVNRILASKYKEYETCVEFEDVAEKA